MINVYVTHYGEWEIPQDFFDDAMDEAKALGYSQNWCDERTFVNHVIRAKAYHETKKRFFNEES